MTDEELRGLTIRGPVAGSSWKHRKGGIYRVVMNAIRESDLVPVVVYRSDETGIAWVRPLSDFTDGRFTLIEGGSIYDA